MKHDVVALLHTYARDGELGSFMAELAQGFASAGCKLHLIVTNSLVDNLTANKYKPSISDKKVAEYINRVNPAFVFTTNRGGITKNIMEAIDCPIITWMVDRIPFMHHGGTHDDLFCDKDFVITSSTINVNRLESIYPILNGKVYYLPFCTNIDQFNHTFNHEKSINISFVGTYFYCGKLTEILNYYTNNKKIYRSIIKFSEELKKNYEIDIDYLISQLNLDAVLKDFALDKFKFKGLIANALSLNRRIKSLDSISDLGLQLYGTENWTNVNQYSLQLLECFQENNFIKTRSQLVEIYDRSKISINVSHVQAGPGLPYRIFDILASSSLLITEYHPESDLFNLFGKPLPIPMYRSNDELRKLCSHYLKDSNERLQLVKECNALVKNGFTFRDRVLDFYKIINAKSPLSSEERVFGDILYVNPNKYFLKTSHTRISVSKKNFDSAHSSHKKNTFVNHFLSKLSIQTKTKLKIYLNRYAPDRLLEIIKRYIRK